MLGKENYMNITTWQIDSQEKLLIEITRELDGVLKMILNICTIYTKYLNQPKNADKQYHQIRIVALGLEQEM